MLLFAGVGETTLAPAAWHQSHTPKAGSRVVPLWRLHW